MACGAGTALATPQYDTITTYYSDDTCSTVVGRRFEMCSGHWSTGTTSQYIDIWYGESCGGAEGCQQTEDNDMCPGSCSDGSDNDGDNLVDGNDPNCWY